jgi:hypothetical protein
MVFFLRIAMNQIEMPLICFYGKIFLGIADQIIIGIPEIYNPVAKGGLLAG